MITFTSAFQTKCSFEIGCFSFLSDGTLSIAPAYSIGFATDVISSDVKLNYVLDDLVPHIRVNQRFEVVEADWQHFPEIGHKALCVMMDDRKSQFMATFNRGTWQIQVGHFVD